MCATATLSRDDMIALLVLGGYRPERSDHWEGIVDELGTLCYYYSSVARLPCGTNAYSVGKVEVVEDWVRRAAYLDHTTTWDQCERIDWLYQITTMEEPCGKQLK